VNKKDGVQDVMYLTVTTPLLVAVFALMMMSFGARAGNLCQSCLSQPLTNSLVSHGYCMYESLGNFTFWISLSLSVLLSPKLGLRPKISQKSEVVFFSFGLSNSLSVSLRPNFGLNDR